MASQDTTRRGGPEKPSKENQKPTKKITRENLDEALRVLRQVLDEEEAEP